MRPSPHIKRDEKFSDICRKTGKTRYKNERSAQKGMTYMWGSSGMTMEEFKDLHAYHCDFCGCWHIGHISKYQTFLSKFTPSKIDN